MKYLLKYTWPLVAMIALAACNKEMNQVTPEPDPNEGKELIALFEDNGYGVTRAYPNPEAFSSDTKVYMRIKSEDKGGSGVRYADATATAGTHTTADDTHNTDWHLSGTHSHLTYASGQERYWDDAFGRKAQLTVYAVAIANRTDATLPTWSNSGWAQVDATTNPNWYTDSDGEDKTMTWTVSTKQTSSTMSNEDLAYSNNIKEGEATYAGCYRQTYTAGNWVKSMVKGRMIWQSQNPSDATVTTGKFDMGHLVFKHALTWITIKLKEGTGFNNSANTDFGWTNKPAGCAQTITLTGFPTTGTFDVSTGGWSITTANNITQMNETTGTPAAQTTRVLNAYVLPGTDLYNTATNVIEFEIDNAKYYVTGKQIAEAIRTGNPSTYASFTTTEAGKNYVINLTVTKKGIERITAAVVPWETIESTDAAAKNTYCTFDFEDRDTKYGSNDGSKFQIYRAEKAADGYITSNDYSGHENAYAWGTKYVAATGKTWDDTNKEWEATNWYWKDNKTFYHFRAAGYTENASGTPLITINTETSTDPDIDYFTIAAGEIGGSSYKDYTWGAPFYDQKSGDTNDWDNGHPLLTYSTTKGFDGTGAEAATPTHQISKAIAATDNQIQMLMFHMTSQITVKVQTTSDASAVTLDDNAHSKYTKVEIINMLPTGKVQMGDGLVIADGSRSEYTEITRGTWDNTNNIVPFTYGVVPQDLTYTESSVTKKIGLRITTPDENQYLVNDLSTCTGSVSTTNLTNPYTASGSLYTIDKWLPNYHYIYTVTIKKKGIDRITAAVVPWETVTGNLGNIDLEN